jgi:ubiquitin-conjugating enzyme E2 D/E
MRPHLQRRIKKEMSSVQDSPFIDVSPVSFGENPIVLVTVEGLPHSPYRGGIFHLSATYPLEYPFKPLRLRFLTTIYHPNIDDRGEICMDIVAENWATNLTITSVIQGLFSLLSDPGLEDPLVPEVAALFVKDRPLYEKNAEMYTKMHATCQQSFPDYGVHPVAEMKITVEELRATVSEVESH